MLQSLLDKFWNEDVWLPPDRTWADVPTTKDDPTAYNDTIYILYPIACSFLVLLLRYNLYKYFLKPLGKRWNIIDNRLRKPKNIPELEAAYRVSKNISQAESLAKKLDLSVRQVQRWWRLRRKQDTPSKLDKFCENSWKSIFYTYNTAYMLAIVWNKDWFWNIEYCYKDYPRHVVHFDVWWLYMATASFHWSLLFSHFWDVRRSDFWQMLFHHIMTISLLTVSWVINFQRVGILILLSNEGTTNLLEGAKALFYAKKHKVCDAMWLVFIIGWCITRLWIFPFHILWSMYSIATLHMSPFPVAYVIFSLLASTVILNIFWTWLIFKFAIANTGRVTKDSRSSSSEISFSSDEDLKKHE